MPEKTLTYDQWIEVFKAIDELDKALRNLSHACISLAKSKYTFIDYVWRQQGVYNFRKKMIKECRKQLVKDGHRIMPYEYELINELSEVTT